VETNKKQKNRYQLCLFVFINNVDLTDDNVKNIQNFLCGGIAAMNLFQIDLDKPWNYL